MSLYNNIKDDMIDLKTAVDTELSTEYAAIRTNFDTQLTNVTTDIQSQLSNKYTLNSDTSSVYDEIYSVLAPSIKSDIQTLIDTKYSALDTAVDG